MVSILLDLAPGLKRDGNVLRQMSEEGLLRELRKASENGGELEAVRTVTKSRDWLADYLMLPDEKADYYVTVLQTLYGLEIEPPKPVIYTSSTKLPEPVTQLKPDIKKSGNDGNLTWTLDNGILTISGTGKMNVYSYDSTPWRQYSEYILSAVVNDGITSIGDNAFRYCTNLTSVSIPDSVISIGQYAFTWCPKLLSVSIPENAQFHADAFDWSATVIRRKAPSQTDLSPKPVPPPKRMTQPVTPPSQPIIPPKPIENLIDSGSYGSLHWTLNTKGTLTISGNGKIWMWDGNDSLLKYGHRGQIHSIVIRGGITSITGNHFSSYKNLTSIQLPDSVTEIGDSSFSFCRDLTSMRLSNSVKKIGDSAFKGCQKLTSIQIPSTVQTIEKNVFCSCENLRSVQISQGVTRIEDYAFYDCKSLISVQIPDSVTYIGCFAFSGCKSLSNVKIPDSVVYIRNHAFQNCEHLTNVQIPDSINSIDGGLFSGCTNLRSVQIPSSVTYIGDGAFYDCKNMTSVYIPDGVKGIGQSAFHNCKNLTSVYIPDSVESIDKYAFDSCANLKNASVSAKTSIGYAAFDKFTKVQKREQRTRAEKAQTPVKKKGWFWF